MSNQALLRRFEEIGARAKLVRAGRPRIDVRVDRRGEYFELGVLGLRDANVMVVDTDDVDRALLLLVRNGWEKSKFLCGFDERHWFVAAIPELRTVWPASSRRRTPSSRRPFGSASHEYGRRIGSADATRRTCGRASGSSCRRDRSSSTSETSSTTSRSRAAGARSIGSSSRIGSVVRPCT